MMTHKQKTNSTSSVKRTCGKIVKYDDTTGIHCEKCPGWFHGACISFTAEDYWEEQERSLVMQWLPPRKYFQF